MPQVTQPMGDRKARGECGPKQAANNASTRVFEPEDKKDRRFLKTGGRAAPRSDYATLYVDTPRRTVGVLHEHP